MQPASNSYVLLPHVLLPLYKKQLSNILTSVVPMLSCGGEGRVQKCLCMCQVPLVTCILLCYAKIMVNSVYLLKDHYSMWDTYARFWCKKQYRFDGNSLCWFIWGDWQTSKRNIASVMCGQFLQVKSWAPLSLPRHRPHRAWSAADIFHVGEVIMPCRGYHNGADFTEVSKIPEILGELSMCK